MTILLKEILVKCSSLRSSPGGDLKIFSTCSSSPSSTICAHSKAKFCITTLPPLGRAFLLLGGRGGFHQRRKTPGSSSLFKRAVRALRILALRVQSLSPQLIPSNRLA